MYLSSSIQTLTSDLQWNRFFVQFLKFWTNCIHRSFSRLKNKYVANGMRFQFPFAFSMFWIPRRIFDEHSIHVRLCFWNLTIPFCNSKTLFITIHTNWANDDNLRVWVGFIEIGTRQNHQALLKSDFLLERLGILSRWWFRRRRVQESTPELVDFICRYFAAILFQTLRVFLWVFSIYNRIELRLLNHNDLPLDL